MGLEIKLGISVRILSTEVKQYHYVYKVFIEKTGEYYIGVNLKNI